MEGILKSQSVAHLKKMVSAWTNSHRIKGYSRMKKDDLVDAMMKEITFKKKDDDEMLRDVVKRMAKASDRQLKAKAAELEKKASSKSASATAAAAAPAPKKELVTLDGEKIAFKGDALRNMLRLGKKEKLTKPLIRKMLEVPVGGRVQYFDKVRRQTPLLRKRLQFALTLMK